MVDVEQDKGSVEQNDINSDAFARLYRKTPALMHSIDVDGRLVEVSDLWAETLGYTREEVIGRKVVEFLTEECALRAVAEIPIGFERDIGAHYVTREFVKKSGEIIEADVTAIWARDENDEPWRSLVVVTDVTKRNRAMRALEKMNKELEATNAELERFAFLASHDLQEPLRKIEAACGVIGERMLGNTDNDTGKFLKMAANSATRMRALIEDLLRFSRLGTSSVNYRDTPMLKPLNAALSSLAQVIDDTGAQIEIGDLPHLPVDEGFVRQLFQNLVGNALKYSGDQPPVVQIDSVADPDGWIIRITDNGIGIPREHSEQIFQAFQRLHSKSEYPGTGIGLAICKRVVERHDGRIWLDTSYRAGSRFCVQFPLNQSTEQGATTNDIIRTHRRAG